MAGEWLDRAIGIVAPQTALRRARARHAFDEATRSYAGAALGRNTDGWHVQSTSADAEIYYAGHRLRDRHRDLVRNNAHAAKAVAVLANNIVGEGIIPRPNTGDEARNKVIKDLWDQFAAECDSEKQLDFYGMQTLAVREMIEGGEVMIRRRRLRKSAKTAIPLQLQILEGDFLDNSRTGDFEKGYVNVDGIQFVVSPDSQGTGPRQGYWLWHQHPGNNFIFMQQSVVSSIVPATEILHLYEKQRTQVRGVPWGAPVIRALRDLDDYEFAEIRRKQTEAAVVGIVTTDDDTDPGIGVRITNAHGEIVERFSPGMFAYARGGKEIKFNNPAVVAGYADYKKAMLRTIAAGYRIPYELLTGDLSDVNFSSIRAGIIEFRRFIRYCQWQIVIPMFLQPAWDWFCEAAYLAGKLDTPTVPVIWAPPKFDWVDPYKDAMAELLAMRSGTRTLKDVIAEHGGDWQETLEDIKSVNDMLDKLEIVLDSDPRNATQLGVLQGDALPDDPDPQPTAKPKGNGKNSILRFTG